MPRLITLVHRLIDAILHNNNIIQELPSVTPRWCKCDMGCFHRALHGLDCCEYCRGVCDCGCSGCLRSDDEDTFFITFLEEENLLFWKTESRKTSNTCFHTNRQTSQPAETNPKEKSLCKEKPICKEKQCKNRWEPSKKRSVIGCGWWMHV